MERLCFQSPKEAALNPLTEDVLKSSEVEGEKLDTDQVRNSIARRLGIDIDGLTPVDRDVEGVVGMMLDATQHDERPRVVLLTVSRVCRARNYIGYVRPSSDFVQ
jgi:hypothetical protein